MSCHYHFENDQYVLRDDRTNEVLDRMAEVTLSIDKQTGKLVAHGRASFVSKIEIRYLDDLLRTGKFDSNQLAGRLMSISGKIPVDILNKCLDISGYAAKFFAGRR